MIFYAMGENPSPVVLIGLYAAKLALLALCFGSGLPGGIFFPLLGLVAMTAYVVAEGFRSEPIYESLQKRLLSSAASDHERARSASPRDRMLVEFGVENLSPADGRTIAEILWPEDSLVIAVKRGSGEIVPSGQVRLMAGDYLVVLIPRIAMREAQEQLESLTKGTSGAAGP